MTTRQNLLTLSLWAGVAIAMLLPSSFAIAQSAVFKCQEGGQTVFKDHPCGGAQGTVAQDVARKELDFKKRNQEQEIAAQQRSAEDAARLKLCGGKFVSENPEVGMTENQFLNCTTLGIYKAWRSVNETETTSGIQRQYVVDRMDVKYVYTRNGMVTGLQR
jgi:hypothetical protein